MYKIVKTEYFITRPKWLVMLLLYISPSHFEKCKELNDCKVILRYIRFCTFRLVGKRDTNKVYIQSSDDAITLLNNRKKPVISFEIKKA